MAQPLESRRELKDLPAAERQELKDAHERLRSAALTYERFLGRRLDDEVPLHNLDEMKTAQEELEAAEAHLWNVRQARLGWPRPADAPPATQVTEWILEEDNAAEQRLA